MGVDGWGSFGRWNVVFFYFKERFLESIRVVYFSDFNNNNLKFMNFFFLGDESRGEFVMEFFVFRFVYIVEYVVSIGVFFRV